MGNLRKFIFFLFTTLILLHLSKTELFAKDVIRVTGFAYPRSRIPLLEPVGGFPEDPDTGDPDGFQAVELYDELIDPANFGPSGIVNCRIEFDDFVQSVAIGSLVNDDTLKFDVFFLSGTFTHLTAVEAAELAAFIEAGGVVYASEIMYNGLISNSINPLLIALGIGDRFRTQIDDRWFGGRTSIPIDTPITNGKFGVVGRLANGQFRKMSHVSLTGVSKGFEELDFVGMSPIVQGPGINSLSDPLEFNLFEKEIDQGYLSVSGEAIYYWGVENMKYMKNLFGFACRDVLGTSTGPEPFLELPWDYASNGHSFTEAALAINSYFDHEYPLLSIGSWREGSDANLIVRYDGYPKINRPYTSHDGYDYGSGSKNKYGTRQLAAADGVATYRYGDATGNAIHIDHRNGFQTRYYHLASEGLVVDSEGQEVEVNQGQQIGLTGFTGNVRPVGESGSHIHFMVVEDKNDDGNFDDNVPDGLVDPFGWQSPDPDPWESFTFNYLGQERTGNKSHYLWIHPLSSASGNVDHSGGSVSNEKVSITFLPFTLDEDLKIYMDSASISGFGLFKSIGSGVRITAKNLTGEIVNSFIQPYEFQIKLTESFLDNIDLNTLSIFSSEDGENWLKEDTEINMENLTAIARLRHLSYFAVMGEVDDSESPTTSIVFTGEEGEDGHFRSDVEISLTSLDESQILYTTYRIDEEDWSEYYSPFVLTDEGEHRVYYYSEDQYGNTEDIRESTIYIDKTHPEIVIVHNPHERKFVYTGLDGETADVMKVSKELIDVFVTDRSGNTVTLRLHNENGWQEDKIIPKSVIYNGSSQLPITSVELATYVHFSESHVLNRFIQRLKHDGDRVNIDYDKYGISTFRFWDEYDNLTKVTQTGIYPITLKTNKGDIEFSY